MPGTEVESRKFPIEPEIDSRVADLVQEFYEDCPNAERGKLLSIKYTGTVRDQRNPTRLGVCYWWDDGATDVELAEQLLTDPRFSQYPIFTKMLVYHELGHCTLGLAHVEEGHQLMSAGLDIWHPEYYQANEQQLIEGMCGK